MLSATPPDYSDSSDSDSTPINKQMSDPQTIKASNAAGRMNKKLAAGLASLYDPMEQDTLISPIYKQSSLEVKQPILIDDLSSPETSTASDSCNTSPTRSQPADDEVIEVNHTDDHMKDRMAVDEESPKSGGLVTRKVRTEWIGTSLFFIDEAVEWNRNVSSSNAPRDHELNKPKGVLDSMILYLKSIEHDLSIAPYDPSIHLDRARFFNKIGFTDIGAASGYRALLLIEAFLQNDPDLYPQVRAALTKKLRSYSTIIINDEVKSLHLQAYQDLLNGLLGCACFWEGCEVAKKALTLFPRDPELNVISQCLKEGFVDRHHTLKALGAEENLVVLSKMGKIYQKSYPWIPSDLYKRKPALVRKVNSNFGAGNCEVRPVVFGTPPLQQRSPRTKESQDVGPLGVFATRNIKAGELVMVDQCVTAISDVPSSRLDHCDACHASLKMPFLPPSEVIKPSCCGKVAFCSKSCYQTASTGYHSIVCGKDFDWLHDKSGPAVSSGTGYKWRKVLFLRIISIIISDRAASIKASKKPIHPLQHHIVARMAANYASPEKLHPNTPDDFQYSENIVAPTQILMKLGINIFTDTDFSQEVVQTIYWRMENNASMSISDLSSANPSAILSPLSKGAVNMICLNTQYLFFNHSCEPNVTWHGAVPNPHVRLSWIMGYGGEVMKVGSSTVFCRVKHDVQAGEELKISYVGDPKGGNSEERGKLSVGREGKREWLKKWFEGGCGCGLCAKENQEEAKAKADEGNGTDVDAAMKLLRMV